MGFVFNLYVAHFYGFRKDGRDYDGFIVMRDAPNPGYMSLTNIDHPFKSFERAWADAERIYHEGDIIDFGPVYLNACGHLDSFSDPDSGSDLDLGTYDYAVQNGDGYYDAAGKFHWYSFD